MRIFLQVLAHLVLLSFGVGIPLLVYYWLRIPLESTVNRLVEMPEATDFYLRSFLIALIFGGLSEALGTLTVESPTPPPPPPPPPPPGAIVAAPPHIPVPPHIPAPPHIMSYIGAGTFRIEQVVHAVSVDLLFFVAVITILAAALLRRQWQTKAS